ncbi:MAG: flagellar assembly protein FliW [Bryobacteraceae bacterium]|nr:flagellar assembly protein FliW [Bryobacteraceae bacterium]
MPSCETKYFGKLDYTESAIILCEAGLPGFESERKFLPLEMPEHKPLVFIQSLSTPGLCFVALPVLGIEPDYRLELAKPDLDALGFESQPAIGTDVLCLALITITETSTTANLLAPLVVNIKTGQCVQAIDPESRYSHRHSLDPEEPAC